MTGWANIMTGIMTGWANNMTGIISLFFMRVYLLSQMLKSKMRISVNELFNMVLKLMIILMNVKRITRPVINA